MVAGNLEGAFAISGARCANCHAPLFGPFCAACGQACDTHRRSLYRLARGFIADLLSLDSRLLRTSWALLARPGELSLAFHEGRTQRYVPPVRLYLFVSLLFFVMLSFTHLALVQFNLSFQSHKSEVDGAVRNAVSTDLVFFQPVGSVHSAVAAPKHEIEKIRGQVDAGSRDSVFMRKVFATLYRLQADPAALNGSLTEWLPRILFVLLPLFAIVLALFYWGSRQFLFVDHLVFSLNLHSFGFVAVLMAGVLAQLASGAAVAWLFFGVVCTYCLLAMKRFYAQGWVRTGLKFAGVGFVYSIFVLLPAFGGLIAASVYYG
jgi:Protein of unknown function (DUF3667)